jgi:hypothetical protein
MTAGHNRQPDAGDATITDTLSETEMTGEAPEMT